MSLGDRKHKSSSSFMECMLMSTPQLAVLREPFARAVF